SPRFRARPPRLVQQVSPPVSVDDLAVRPERFLAELLPAVRAPDPRPGPFGILVVQRPEESRHLERDLRGFRLGAVESLYLAEEVHVQVDLGALRDPVEAAGLESHVEPLAVV